MCPEYLIKFAQATLALDLANAKGCTVTCYPDTDEHGDIEAALGDGKLQGVRVTTFHVADLDRLAATVDRHHHAVVLV